MEPAPDLVVFSLAGDRHPVLEAVELEVVDFCVGDGGDTCVTAREGYKVCGGVARRASTADINR